MMANIVAAEALAGKDNFCVNYLKAFAPACSKAKSSRTGNFITWIGSGLFIYRLPAAVSRGGGPAPASPIQ